MSLKMHQRGGHFYRKVGTYSARVSMAGLATLIPMYQVTAVHSPAYPRNSGSASPLYAAPESSGKKSTRKKGATLIDPKSASDLVSESCAYRPERNLRPHASSQLQSLVAYEKLCGGAVFSSLSFFISTPTTNVEASELASYVSGKLKEFRAADVHPVVFMEPTAPSGLVDMRRLASGTYDNAITTFFSQLAASGITDSDMGTWVPVPEGNLPVWTNLEPSVYSASVARIARIQKQQFPSSKISLLLDTITYPTNGLWSGGSAKSLLPYVHSIPSNLVDSFGLQGLPWVSPADEGAIVNGSVSQFLKPQLAVEAAKQLGVGQIWINSGTFVQKYRSVSQKVAESPSQRSEQLDEIIAAALQLKNAGYATSLHLFAENKLDVAEQTNWSYLPESASAGHQATFTHLAARAHTLGIDLWLFDS